MVDQELPEFTSRMRTHNLPFRDEPYLAIRRQFLESYQGKSGPALFGRSRVRVIERRAVDLMTALVDDDDVMARNLFWRLTSPKLFGHLVR